MPEEEELEASPTEKAEEKEEVEEKPFEPREELKIKDFSVYKPCSICSENKVSYIELEVDGKIESTCKECYEGISTPKPKVSCPSCASECEGDDNFCWRCGERLCLICPTCGEKSDIGDKFCRQCGSKL